jgi:hypothetical protein
MTKTTTTEDYEHLWTDREWCLAAERVRAKLAEEKNGTSS